MADDTSPEQKRQVVADRAGLSAAHGSSARIQARWQGACNAEGETHTTITLVREVEAEVAEKETHVPLECPVCGEEHLMARVP